MVYLDNAATTVCKFPASAYDDNWGNANTPYKFGLNARQTADECRERVKKCLGVKGGKVIFCSNASEAVRILCNRMLANGFYTFCGPYEHDSVYYNVDVHGYSTEELYGSKYDKNDAIFQQWVNPVTGLIFDIPDIRKSIGNDCFICMDATAGIGKRFLTQSIVNSVDAIWFSGHKFHGPKTGGILWVSDRLSKALYLSDDSRNEYGLKHGTLDVPSFIATTCALEYTITNDIENIWHYAGLNDYLLNRAGDRVVGFQPSANDHLNATLLIDTGCNADALVQYLSSKSIYVGLAHSACSADADYRVTQAFGISKETAERCIRVSFSEDNTFNDIDALVNGIKEFKEKFV